MENELTLNFISFLFVSYILAPRLPCFPEMYCWKQEQTALEREEIIRECIFDVELYDAKNEEYSDDGIVHLDRELENVDELNLTLHEEKTELIRELKET